MLNEQEWIENSQDPKANKIRSIFLATMENQNRHFISYYDFLLAAKQLNFRFEDSTHLMDLRKYFFRHKNRVTAKKLAPMLQIFSETIREWTNQNSLPVKIIVRFNIQYTNFQSIKQATNEDEQGIFSKIVVAQEDKEDYLNFHPIKKKSEEDTIEVRQKLAIILSIKVEEMIKKIKIIRQGIRQLHESQWVEHNIYTIFNKLSSGNIHYEMFRKAVSILVRKVELHLSKEKLTMTEDDIKAIFFILDEEKNGFISRQRLNVLEEDKFVVDKISDFYRLRINKRMVKNTYFKLGRASSNLEIYHVKNASLLEFKNIQESILVDHRKQLQQSKSRQKVRKIPHFGPIKGLAQKSRANLTIEKSYRSTGNRSSLSTYKRPDDNHNNVNQERSRIEKIIRNSKDDRKKKNHDTVANKLRKLFIHKVILPRQKLIQQQKAKYTFNKQNSNISIKLV